MEKCRDLRQAFQRATTFARDYEGHSFETHDRVKETKEGLIESDGCGSPQPDDVGVSDRKCRWSIP